MKKRRIAIVAFLLCAVMAIGIGYAATTGALNIVGTMVATEEDYKVVISAAEVYGELPAGVSVTFDCLIFYYNRHILVPINKKELCL